MIRYQDQILLDGEPVFTKISIETPMRDPLVLPADACYLYVEQGEGHVLLRSGNIRASPGTVILSTCGMTVGKIMAEQAPGRMDSMIVHFNQSVLQDIFQEDKPALWEELKVPVHQYVVQTAANELTKHYFNSLTLFFQNKAALKPSILKLKLKEIILLLLQSDNPEPVRQIINNLFSASRFSFKELIDAHVLTAASIENLAMLTNCSISTFKRKFRAIYNTSPGKYFLEKRLDKIAENLRTSDEPISQLGYDLGFESPEHLSRVFKKKFGLPPSSYRSSFSIK